MAVWYSENGVISYCYVASDCSRFTKHLLYYLTNLPVCFTCSRSFCWYFGADLSSAIKNVPNTLIHNEHRESRCSIKKTDRPLHECHEWWFLGTGYNVKSSRQNHWIVLRTESTTSERNKLKTQLWPQLALITKYYFFSYHIYKN